MKQSGILKKLSEIEATEFPFISVYLNTEPNENGKSDFDVFIRKQLKEHADNYAEETPERESFDRDAELISDYLEKIKPETRGAAIFACSANDFFQTIEFYVPFRNNHFSVSDK